MKKLRVGPMWAAFLFSAFAMPTASGQSVHVAPDVPTQLAAQPTLLPDGISLVNLNAVVATTTTIPGSPEIDALHARTDGSWLFSVAAPFTSGASTYLPGDVLSFANGNVSTVLSGTALGLPPGVRIDALARRSNLQGGINYLFSFDVPVDLGGTTYLPADVVEYDGAGFARAFDSTLVPDLANQRGNVIGVADGLAAGDLYVAFDIPVYPGAGVASGLPAILPGTLGIVSAAGLQQGPAITGWPVASLTNGVSLAPPSSTVGTTLRVQRVGTASNPPVDVSLSWGADCSVGTGDYAVYRGTIGNWSGHQPLSCTTGGSLDWSSDAGTGNYFYLVVPQNGWAEGSYGKVSAGVERAASAGACLAARQIADCSVQ